MDENALSTARSPHATDGIQCEAGTATTPAANDCDVPSNFALQTTLEEREFYPVMRNPRAIQKQELKKTYAELRTNSGLAMDLQGRANDPPTHMQLPRSQSMMTRATVGKKGKGSIGCSLAATSRCWSCPLNSHETPTSGSLYLLPIRALAWATSFRRPEQPVSANFLDHPSSFTLRGPVNATPFPQTTLVTTTGSRRCPLQRAAPSPTRWWRRDWHRS